jgi:actin related protein 2/3 complex, subunit 1A/1B
VIALSPNDNTVQIYETGGSTDTTKWVKKWELQEHTKLVMDIDWAVKSNQILTAGQDRNAYVWTLDGKEWKPSLVLLKIHRSATCCRWSVNEDKVRNFKKVKKKFAVGSGAKILSICYYDEDNDNKWWVSKMVKKNKPHCSTILSCAWHPTDNLLLLTGCGDNKARFMTCYLKDTDPKDRKCEFPSVHATQETTGWVHSVAWSPSGKTYAYTGHDSTLYVSDAQSHEVVTVPTTGNPFKKLLYLSETSIVAVGHDFTPVLFSSHEGEWKCYGKAEARHKNTIKFFF